jgi:hypothetical protein
MPTSAHVRRSVLACLLLCAVITVTAQLASAEPLDRQVAEWVLRKGGSVTLHPDARIVWTIAELPGEDFRLQSVNLAGTLIEPKELARLRGLADLKELYLSGPMWNPVCCGPQGKMDESDELRNLSGLVSLEKLHLTHHFHSTYHGIHVKDHGLEHLAPLKNLSELRLKYCRATAEPLKPFTKLRFLDGS